MIPEEPPSIYRYRASPCGGYSPQGSILKQWYNSCKSEGFICPTELKIYYHSKGAGRNRETPRLSYKFGEQIDARDAQYAYSLLKVSCKSFMPSFSFKSNPDTDSVFRTLMRLSFDLSSFCLSIKIKGQSTRCQHDRHERKSSLYGNQVVLKGTDSDNQLICEAGDGVDFAECAQVVEIFTRCSSVRPSILQELNGLGFDLTTLKVSFNKVLID